MSRELTAAVHGVVGGMGPLASAEFLKTIYEFGLAEHEETRQGNTALKSLRSISGCVLRRICEAERETEN